MRTVLVLALMTASCGAMRNPKRPEHPSPWTLDVNRVDESVAADASEGGPHATGDAAQAVQDRAAGAAAAAQQKAPVIKEDLAIAIVAGQPILASALFAQWLHRSSDEVLDELDQLVMERMVELECARLGIEVSAQDVDRAYQRGVKVIETQLERGGRDMSFDDYIERVLGLDPKTYRDRLRRSALHALLAERAFRAFLLTSEHAYARMIVVRTEGDAEIVQRELDAGRPFQEVAAEFSIEDKDLRGELVPVLKSGTLMSRLVFQTPVGEVAGPSNEQGAYVFVLVVERPAALTGNWSEIGREVLATLIEQPVQELEITQWRAAMQRQYEVDLSPFLQLAGEPPKMP